MTTTTRTPKAPSAWRRWRTARPFWGGLLVTLGGAEILLAVKAPLPVILHVGMQGLVGYLVPMVLVLCGVLLLVSPAQRLFYSTLAAGLSLASWLTSNLGGFFLGLLLGLIGSALAFAWTPDRKPSARKKRKTPEPIADPATGTNLEDDTDQQAYAVPEAAGPRRSTDLEISTDGRVITDEEAGADSEASPHGEPEAAPGGRHSHDTSAHAADDAAYEAAHATSRPAASHHAAGSETPPEPGAQPR